MRFRLEQRLSASPDDVARTFADPAYYATLHGMSKLGPPDVLSHDGDGDEVRLRIRYQFVGELNSAARAVLDPARLTWVEESVHHLGRCTVDLRLVPDNY